MLALLVPLGVAAEEDAEEPWKVTWKNGFKFDSPDGQFKLKIGGRVQADFTFADADSELEDLVGPIEDGNEFRRTRLYVAGTIYGNVEFKAQYDFVGGDADFNDLYLGFKDTPIGNIRVGHFFEPFSLEQQTSSKNTTFVERGLTNVFSPARNMGLMVYDKVGDRFTWAVGAFRDSNSFGSSQGDGKLNLTGRITGLPIYEEGGKRLLHLGLSVTTKDLGDSLFRFRSRPTAHQTPRFVDTGSFAADSVDILNLELGAVHGPFWAMGEYAQAEADTSLLGNPSFDGFHVGVGYFLTGEHRAYKSSGGKFDRITPAENFSKGGGRGAWEVAIRFSNLDLTDGAIDGGEMDDLTLGLNWYLNPATRMLLNYIDSEVEGVGSASFVVLRFQVAF